MSKLDFTKPMISVAGDTHIYIAKLAQLNDRTEHVVMNDRTAVHYRVDNEGNWLDWPAARPLRNETPRITVYCVIGNGTNDLPEPLEVLADCSEAVARMGRQKTDTYGIIKMQVVGKRVVAVEITQNFGNEVNGKIDFTKPIISPSGLELEYVGKLSTGEPAPYIVQYKKSGGVYRVDADGRFSTNTTASPISNKPATAGSVSPIYLEGDKVRAGCGYNSLHAARQFALREVIDYLVLSVEDGRLTKAGVV